ncbi:hypothetical protein VPHD249_0109 [Vibrio phage D249]|nr:hypothetical protein SIPHO036v1_90012 [Vibrio phage 70E38.1]QZI88005.1 hypothetical protein SIPHO041v1_p0094 [Vibrio phage 234P1]QZI88177.1 hypothetical protein SIPHO035v1_p0086 [Vibrio phage 234P7B]QZI88355.1 hypothetical protein SIPHO082v1_p0078 [Vibrio phage 294E48.1]QZI88544.1 hypothetical protein SIPHO037v1_p0103 [Vibrio phage 70E35.2]QZI88729.1 hypothetical protein SIPHO039v1_p0100 [Vibrio phage 70E35.5a]QZI88912.1 hypothetical protein SIPHO040v1_p0099 [Vibrio phage 70E35.6]QZI89108
MTYTHICVEPLFEPVLELVVRRFDETPVVLEEFLGELYTTLETHSALEVTSTVAE